MIDGARFLVTGGAGMIGSNLVKRLASLGGDVTVVDNLWRGKLENLKAEDGTPVIDLERSFVRADLSEPGVLDDYLSNTDYVIHLADVVAGIGYVFSHEGEIFRQNVLINSNVVSSVRRHGDVKGYLYVGTACSFPASKQFGVEAPPLVEEDQYPAAPESAYGWSKLMGEYEALLMEKETGIPVAIPILHNVYGTPCDYGEVTAQVIPSLVRKAARYPDEPFVVWGSGAQGRAFVHVDDVVDGLVVALQRGLGHGTFQLGPDHCTSIKEIAELVVDVSGKSIDVQFDRSKPEGDKGRCADFSKARRVLGWEPRVSLRDGMSALFDWVHRRLESNAPVGATHESDTR